MELVGEAFILDLEFSSVVQTMVSLIDRLLRVWIVPVIRYLHLLVELFLIGLGLGDSRLVIHSPLFLTLFLL